jgi:hypothetical protein
LFLLRDDWQTRTGLLVEEGGSSRFFDREEESRMVLASSKGAFTEEWVTGRRYLDMEELREHRRWRDCEAEEATLMER